MGLKSVAFCEKMFKDGLDYVVRTQDFTDEEIKKAVELVRPYYWEDLADYLAKLTDDPNVHAHLKGFRDAKEREEIVANIKRLQERCKW